MSTKAKSQEVSNKETEKKETKKYAGKLPKVADFLKAGVQFGHETKKWDPAMKKYIFADKDNIHIIDISKTLPLLEEALQFLYQISLEGPILMVGTKRQASEIVKEAAMEAGAYFVTNRWPGGLLTNFEQIKQSIKVYNELEREFEEGIEGRTKFEISNMKKQWEKMNRLYEGIKSMQIFPKAVVVVDTKFEKNAIKEARALGLPIIAIVDTNSNPAGIDYPIPANDDAIGSIKILMQTFVEAIKAANSRQWVTHTFKDYSKAEIKIKKTEDKNEELVEITEESKVEEENKVDAKKSSPKKLDDKQVGALESIQREAESKKVQKASKERESKK